MHADLPLLQVRPSSDKSVNIQNSIPQQTRPRGPDSTNDAFWSWIFFSGASSSRLWHLTQQISVSASSLDRKQTSPAASKHIHNSTYTSRASIYSFDAPSVYLFRLICHSIHPFDRVIAPLTPLPSHCFGVNRRVTSLSWHPYHDRYPPVTIKHFNVCPEQSPAFSRINDERSFVRTVSTATAISSQPVPSAATVSCTIHNR